MSFSSDTKKELSTINNYTKIEQIKQELCGYLISCNTTTEKKGVIRYATENEYNINRFSKILKNLNIDFSIEMDGKNFVIKLKGNEALKSFCQKNYNKLTEEDKKALIRGAFMGSGSINNPNNKYHLEMSFSTEKKANQIIELLNGFGFNFKTIYNQNKYSIYIKEGEEISSFLALIGANSAVLKFEDIRVQREMRGKVNRLVNCKSANLNKTINASIEQIEAIKKIQNNKKFEKMDEDLKEIAHLRLENPDVPLAELGKKLSKPIGKSGVNYRLKKIIELSKE